MIELKYENRTKPMEQVVISTHLAHHLETAVSKKEKLDETCKKLLAHKNVLARILKTCATEYAACTLEDIEHRYIEGMPQISESPVHRDEVLDSEKAGMSVGGVRNEDSSMTEGTVTYDIIFKALNPMAEHELIQMIVNIEGQGDAHPGYPLTKRGVYYGSRMISSQYGTVFVDSHYEKLQKVYSIWICLGPTKYRENTINRYAIREERLMGSIEEDRANYDLMDVVMVGLAKTDPDESEGPIRMLSVMFAGDMNLAEKKEILEGEFGLAMSRTMEKEVTEMGSYADCFIEEGIEQGMQRGLQQGMLTALQNLMRNMKMTPEQAMDALSIPEQDRKAYDEKLRQQ